MKMLLHTMRKDVRRLWPAVVVFLALLTTLTRADRWRFNSMFGSTEGWLNLVVSLAWACLIALAVLEEPLAGDRHFWLTRPHRWPALLAAKLIFALLFVHLPLLIADGYILAAHGFSPFESLPQLLWKQLAFAAFVTLPALALAAMIPSFTHFMLGTFAIAAAAAFTVVVGGARTELTWPRRPDDYLRGEITAVLIAAACIVIVWLQYRRRPAVIARTVGIAAALIAWALIGLVPESADYQARALLHPIQAALSLRIEPRAQALGFDYRSGSRFGIPVVLSGLPAGAAFRTAALTLTVTAPDGRRYTNTAFTLDNQWKEVQLEAKLFPYPYDEHAASLWLTLRFDAAVYTAVKDGKVRLTGHTAVSLVRQGETAWMPVGGRVAAPGVGHCSSDIRENRSSEPRVNVVCESPSDIPPAVRAIAWTREDGQRYQWALVNYGNLPTGLRTAWLSPLNRCETSIELSDPKYRLSDPEYGRYPFLKVPMEYLANARIAVTPEFVTGYAVVNFDFPDVVLSKYWVEPRRVETRRVQ
jgi:hypothetical protein